MARYTKKDADGRYYIESVNGKLESDKFGHTYGEAIDRFAELENGVIVLPCKVGDTVYSCIGRSYKVKKITIKSEQEHMIIVLDSALSGQLIVDETDFGRIVFLTKELAEKALAEREGKNNG